MAVGQHQAVGRDHDAGAEPAALARDRQSGSGLDPDDGVADTFGNVDDGIGISIEQTRVVRGSRLGGLQRYPIARWVTGNIQHGKIPSVAQIVRESCCSKRPCNACGAATDEEQADLNRALLIAARSRQQDWTRFFYHRIRRRAATAASNLDAGCHGKTVRDDEGFRPSRASTCVARSRRGTFKTWHVQDVARSRPGTFKTWHVQDLARPACTTRTGLSLTLGAVDLRFAPLPWASNHC